MPIPRWITPWPPVRINEHEWVILRDDPRRPAALVRRLEFGPHAETFYRIVSWAERSEQRRLFGYVRTLELADMAVTFRREPDQVRAQLSVERSREWGVFTSSASGPH